ncbi:polyprenyl synthetase family protein [Nitratifractor sp.]
MQDFETFLVNHMPTVDTFHPEYNEALQAMLLAGGKRFRPRLLLGIVEAYQPLLLESAMHPALALEIFHTYSLIHDDLPAMDDAQLRRGHPTLHTRYDEALAILAGDALNTYAFEILVHSPFRADVRVELVRILAENGGSGGMVLGQAIDLRFENEPLTLEQVIELHRNKTAKLIAAALEMGTVIVGLDPEIRRELYDYGIELGLLFQVQDDILDATQSPEEAGKPTGHDSEKNSFVTLLGLEGALAYADALSESLEKRFETFDEPIRRGVGAMIRRYLHRHRSEKDA